MFAIPSTYKVNTVNCVGVMGKGIALEFKERDTKMFAAYKRWCSKDWIGPGDIGYYISDSGEYVVVLFATKDHWRDPSRYEWIDKGLKQLKSFLDRINDEKISITIPPLGCGNGGLDWKIVKPMIKEYLSTTKCQVIVFEPEKE